MELSSEALVSFQFQHFLLTEMPGFFVQTAAEHARRPLRAHDALPMEAIPRIIEDALKKAFGTWKERGNGFSTQDAANAQQDLLPVTTSTSPFPSLGPPTTYPTAQVPTPVGNDFAVNPFITAPFVADIPPAIVGDGAGFTQGTLFPPCGPPVSHSFQPYEQQFSWESSPSLSGTDLFSPGLNYFQPSPDGYRG